ncbi:hypothetical protein MMC21_003829 [Puttea exsequens]|nr:hypothetical protein [Puttea exsequens]
MDGAAKGIAGVALSAVSVAALFTTCIDCFDIVIKARDFGSDYQVLCADLALQRLHFCLWGESVGLASRDPNREPVRHPGLDDPSINPTIAQALIAIELLLKQTDGAEERFDAKTTTSQGLRLFKDTFVRFRRGQTPKQQSLTTVTWWAVHAGDKFKEKIEQLTRLINGLDSMTRILGVSDLQHSRMRDECDFLENIEDLRLIENASLHSQPDVSDTASRRIMMIESGSIARTLSEMYLGTSSTG